MINWQPISTAPKDKDVLIFVEGVVIQGRWSWDEWNVVGWGYDSGCPDEEPTHWAEINIPASDPTYENYKILEGGVKEKMQHKRRGVIGHLLEDDARSILESESPAAHYLSGREDLAEEFAGKLRDILKKVRKIEADQ